MKGFLTVYVRGVALFVRSEPEGNFLVFNPAENVGTVFSLTELLMLADFVENKDLQAHAGINRFNKMIGAIGVKV